MQAAGSSDVWLQCRPAELPPVPEEQEVSLVVATAVPLSAVAAKPAADLVPARGKRRASAATASQRGAASAAAIAAPAAKRARKSTATPAQKANLRTFVPQTSAT